jgi:chitinase
MQSEYSARTKQHRTEWVKLNVVLAELQIYKDWIKLILTWEDGDCHWCVHEEQHIEEQETQITEDLGSIITNIIVQGTDQKSNQDMSKQSQVHQSLQTVFARSQFSDKYT